MITLSVLTGVAPEAWNDLGARGIATAFDVLEQLNKSLKSGPSTEDDGKVYGG